MVFAVNRCSLMASAANGIAFDRFSILMRGPSYWFSAFVAACCAYRLSLRVFMLLPIVSMGVGTQSPSSVSAETSLHCVTTTVRTVERGATLFWISSRSWLTNREPTVKSPARDLGFAPRSMRVQTLHPPRCRDISPAGGYADARRFTDL